MWLMKLAEMNNSKDESWNSREYILGVEAQAAVSTALSIMVDTWERNVKRATTILCFAKTSFFFFFQSK
jgi:hypothetical protein